MIISQVNKDKDEFFINRYMELGKFLWWSIVFYGLILISAFWISDAKLRNAPDVFESSWKLDMLKWNEYLY